MVSKFQIVRVVNKYHTAPQGGSRNVVWRIAKFWEIINLLRPVEQAELETSWTGSPIPRLSMGLSYKTSVGNAILGTSICLFEENAE